MKKSFNCVGLIVNIQIILFVRLLGGLYFKVSTNKFLQSVARIYCVLCAFITVAVLCRTLLVHNKNGDYGSFLKTLSTIIVYILNCIINFLYDGEYFLKFRKQIVKLDSVLGSRLVEDITFSKFLFIIIVIHNVSSIIGICILNSALFGYGIAILFLVSAAQVQQTIMLSSITKTMMFESIYRRMKLLRKRFERDLSVARRFEDGESIMTKNLRKCMNIYKNLLGTVHISDTPMKIMIFLAIAAVIPNSLILTYEVINNTAFKYTKVSVGDTIVALTIPFIPGVFVELINSEAEKIRLRVVKQLMVYKGTTARDAVLDMVKYFDQRPFRYTICRMIAIDLTLVLTMIGLITTYVLALIQFAHIYD